MIIFRKKVPLGEKKGSFSKKKVPLEEKKGSFSKKKVPLGENKYQFLSKKNNYYVHFIFFEKNSTSLLSFLSQF